MPKLINITTGREVASSVELADTIVARLVGLLGRGGLPEGRALWIKRCDSVHTWFMRFAIDVVFVDSSMTVTRVHRSLKPWRVTMPAFRPRSVFELPAGTLERIPVSRGDRLHVGD